MKGRRKHIEAREAGKGERGNKREEERKGKEGRDLQLMLQSLQEK